MQQPPAFAVHRQASRLCNPTTSGVHSSAAAVCPHTTLPPPLPGYLAPPSSLTRACVLSWRRRCCVVWCGVGYPMALPVPVPPAAPAASWPPSPRSCCSCCWPLPGRCCASSSPSSPSSSCRMRASQRCGSVRCRYADCVQARGHQGGSRVGGVGGCGGEEADTGGTAMAVRQTGGHQQPHGGLGWMVGGDGAGERC